MGEKLRVKLDQHSGKVVVGVSFGATLTMATIVYAAGGYVSTIDQHTKDIAEIKTDLKQELRDMKADIKVLIERSHK